MDLFEYQAKQLFARHGVAVPDGRVADSPAQAGAVAGELGGRVVVKAQVKTGGRGKAGGVRVVDGPPAAAAAAADILGMDIRGHTVHTVLVERAGDIAEEYYASLLVDRSEGGYLCICSREGGIEIEEVAATRPEALARVPVSAAAGLDRDTASGVAAAAALPAPVRPAVAELLVRLWRVFSEADATLVEVNPLVRTTDDRVVALDAKVTLDDNAAFRHPDFAQWADPAAVDPLERRARELQLNYVKLDGRVGVIGNGAGLVMSTLDVVAYAGEAFGGVTPANFLDIGGGASAEVMANGLSIVLADPAVRSVFVNVFGGITACDAVAAGIITALRSLDEAGTPATRPLVVRLDGNAAAAGRRMLREAALPVVRGVDSMDGAARLAAELAAAETSLD